MLDASGFGSKEVQPALKEVRGPVDSFKIEESFKIAAKQTALGNGTLDDISFHAFPAMGDLNQKRIRLEGLRAWRIWQNLKLEEVSLSIEDRGMQGYAERIICQATLVESSRRAFLAETGESGEDPEFYRDMISSSIDALYPKPDAEIAAQCLALFVPKIEYLSQLDDEKAATLASEFAAEYPFIKDHAKQPLEVIEPGKAAELKGLLIDKYQPAFNTLKTEFGDVSNANLAEVIARFLELTGLTTVNNENGDRTGWVVEETASRNGFFVKAEDRVLECGKRSKEITWPAFMQLMIHEVGVHATRAERGYQLGSQLLALGLGGYEEAEEGVALLYEKVWAGTATDADVIDRDDYRYLVAAYAAGMVDGTAHSKDETFQFIAKLNAINLIVNDHKAGINLEVEETMKKARGNMFEHVYRAFRGMPDGIVLTKDMVYKEGKIKLVRYINQSTETMAAIDNFLTRGKFDPTNPEHINLVKAIENGQAAS